jgi:hypothetical protein
VEVSSAKKESLMEVSTTVTSMDLYVVLLTSNLLLKPIYAQPSLPFLKARSILLD